MECSPFLRGFLPGIIIGIFSSILLLSLWRSPSLSRANLSTSSYPPSQFQMEVGEDDGEAVTQGSALGNCTGFAGPVKIESSYLLLVLVYSDAALVDLRNSIRETWLKERSERYLGRFMVAAGRLTDEAFNELACENKMYGDLVILPGVNESKSYGPDSETLVEGYLWAMENVKFSYIFKCNDGTFAIVNSLVKYLEPRGEDSTDFLWGFFSGGIQASREEEENWFLCSHYLPHPEGGGYVISRSLVEMLAIMSTDLFHYNDDGRALGVWITPFEGIQMKHDVRFNTGFYSRGCNNAYIVTAKETPESMHQKYDIFSKKGVICSEEFQSRLSYVFNFTAPANKCCVRKEGIP